MESRADGVVRAGVRASGCICGFKVRIEARDRVRVRVRVSAKVRVRVRVSAKVRVRVRIRVINEKRK